MNRNIADFSLFPILDVVKEAMMKRNDAYRSHTIVVQKIPGQIYGENITQREFKDPTRGIRKGTVKSTLSKTYEGSDVAWRTLLNEKKKS